MSSRCESTQSRETWPEKSLYHDVIANGKEEDQEEKSLQNNTNKPQCIYRHLNFYKSRTNDNQ